MSLRICCDRCGELFINDGKQLIKPVIKDGNEYYVCPECGWVCRDATLERPDEWVDGLPCLNIERFGWLWNLPMFKKKGLPHGKKAYQVWRDAHPELGSRFDMCDFKEVDGIEEKIAELWISPDEDE